MIEPTEKQVKILESHMEGDFYRCPQCTTKWYGVPPIENKGEAETQVYCLYGCGYMFIEKRNNNHD